MPTYRITIERGLRFQLDLEADSRFDALHKATTTALHYDAQDQKQTRFIAIEEIQLQQCIESETAKKKSDK